MLLMHLSVHMSSIKYNVERELLFFNYDKRKQRFFVIRPDVWQPQMKEGILENPSSFTFASCWEYLSINKNDPALCVCIMCSRIRDLVNKETSNSVVPGKWKLQTKVESFEKKETEDREEEHPRKVSVVDLETTSPHLPRRVRWMARNVDRREGCGWTDGWTDGRAHRWRVARSEKGCRRIPMALHRRGLQPHRRLYAPDGYRECNKSGGKRRSDVDRRVATGSLSWCFWRRVGSARGSMRVEAHGPHAACDARASFMLLRSAFPLSRLFLDSWNWHRDSWLLRFRGVRKRSLIVTIFNWKLFHKKL